MDDKQQIIIDLLTRGWNAELNECMRLQSKIDELENKIKELEYELWVKVAVVEVLAPPIPRRKRRS